MPKSAETTKGKEANNEKGECLLLRAPIRKILMSNDFDSPTIVTDPQTGEGISFGDETHINTLKARWPLAHKIYQEVASRLEEWTGMTMEELKDFDLRDHRKKLQVVKKIEEGIVKNLPFLEKYGALRMRKSKLKEYGKLANDFFDYLKLFLPESTQDYVSWESSVTVNNNAGHLVVKFLSDGDLNMRHEAKIKLLLMIHLGLTDHNEKDGVDFEEALGFIMDLVNEKITKYENGDAIGKTQTHFLLTKHRKKDKATTSVEITNDPNKFKLEKNAYKKIIEMRHVSVKNQQNEERTIRILIDPRDKNIFSKAAKALRSNDEPKNQDHDYHGMRFIFENMDDLEDFEKILIEKLRKEYIEDLVHQYELAKQRGDVETCKELMEKIGAPDEETIHEYELARKRDEKEECRKLRKKMKGASKCISKKQKGKKNTIEGGEFKGSSRGSSKDFKVKKYRLTYHHPCGKDMSYEFQFMLLDGYADTKFRYGVNDEEYHAKRVYEDGLMDLIAPHIIYAHFDSEKAKKEKIREIRDNIDINLNAHSKKGLIEFIRAVINNPDISIEELISLPETEQRKIIREIVKQEKKKKAKNRNNRKKGNKQSRQQSLPGMDDN